MSTVLNLVRSTWENVTGATSSDAVEEEQEAESISDVDQPLPTSSSSSLNGQGRSHKPDLKVDFTVCAIPRCVLEFYDFNIVLLSDQDNVADMTEHLTDEARRNRNTRQELLLRAREKKRANTTILQRQCIQEFITWMNVTGKKRLIPTEYTVVEYFQSYLTIRPLKGRNIQLQEFVKGVLDRTAREASAKRTKLREEIANAEAAVTKRRAPDRSRSSQTQERKKRRRTNASQAVPAEPAAEPAAVESDETTNSDIKLTDNDCARFKTLIVSSLKQHRIAISAFQTLLQQLDVLPPNQHITNSEVWSMYWKGMLAQTSDKRVKNYASRVCILGRGYITHVKLRDIGLTMSAEFGVMERAAFFTSFACHFRGSTLLGLEWADMSVHDIPNVGPHAYEVFGRQTAQRENSYPKTKALSFLIQSAKTVKDGNSRIRAMLRAKDYQCCPIGAIASSFFELINVQRQSLSHRLEESSKWFDLKLWKAQRDPYTAMTTKTWSRRMRTVLVSNDYDCGKRMHMPRLVSAQWSQNRGTALPDLSYGGGWGQSSFAGTTKSMVDSYLSKLPIPDMLALANFNPQDWSSYYLPRAYVTPPDSLRSLVFPKLDEWWHSAQVGDFDKTMDLTSFLKVLEFFRDVFLQDLVLWESSLDSDHPVTKIAKRQGNIERVTEHKPVFSGTYRTHCRGITDHPDWKDFSAAVKAKVAEPDPTKHSLAKFSPMVANELKEIKVGLNEIHQRQVESHLSTVQLQDTLDMVTDNQSIVADSILNLRDDVNVILTKLRPVTSLLNAIGSVSQQLNLSSISSATTTTSSSSATSSSTPTSSSPDDCRNIMQQDSSQPSEHPNPRRRDTREIQVSRANRQRSTPDDEHVDEQQNGERLPPKMSELRAIKTLKPLYEFIFCGSSRTYSVVEHERKEPLLKWRCKVDTATMTAVEAKNAKKRNKTYFSKRFQVATFYDEVQKCLDEFHHEMFGDTTEDNTFFACKLLGLNHERQLSSLDKLHKIIIQQRKLHFGDAWKTKDSRDLARYLFTQPHIQSQLNTYVQDELMEMEQQMVANELDM
jgi:hypothetical protein